LVRIGQRADINPKFIDLSQIGIV